ncbi:AAA family ATPase [Namhaeicola litoreus]|uniref:AAA family ATPase n=1 Tax=Namhaeicola litoreus TaxID=1052145 RepID=A0ABW3Y3Y6_9FLAO
MENTISTPTIKQVKANLPQLEGVFTGAQLLNRKQTKILNLLNPIFPKVGLVALGGSSDTGKSSLLRQFAISVALNKSEFLDFKINTVHHKAIYVSTEDDEYSTTSLLKKTQRLTGNKEANYENIKFVFNTENLLGTLATLLEQEPVDLIVIDAYSDVFTGQGNDSSQVRSFLNQYSQLAQKYKCLIIFLHHTGKRTEDLTPSKNNLLGSQGFEAKMRLVLELRLDREDPNKRHLCVVKGNYLPQEFKQKSYVLIFDKNQCFTMTNEKVPFENLANHDKTVIKNRIIALKKEGKTQNQIAKELGISQPTVSRSLK